MRKAVLLIFLLVLVFPCFSEEKKWKNYTNNKYGYEIQYPSQWKKFPGEGDSWIVHFYVVDEKCMKYPASSQCLCEHIGKLLIQVYDSEGLSLEKWINEKDILDELAKEEGKTMEQLYTFQKLPFKIDRREALACQYKGTLMSIYLKNNRYIYVFSLLEDNFEEVLKTFKFISSSKQ